MAGGREAIIMDVYEAVTSRRAVRGFTNEPVSREVLERVLTGARLAELKTHAVERVAHGEPWDERQYEMYPRALKSPYGERLRETVAEVLSPSDELILFCGMSIGYEDPAASHARTGRAPLEETVTFVGG